METLNDFVVVGKPGKGHLFIVRGVPGSGKSTYASKMTEWFAGLFHIEADMWFKRHGTYAWKQEEVYRAWTWCRHTAQVILNQGGKVVVSNTFITWKDLKDYIKYAKTNGHAVTLVTMCNEYGSIHGVPEETMQRMRERFETHESIRNKIQNVDQC